MVSSSLAVGRVIKLNVAIKLRCLTRFAPVSDLDARLSACRWASNRYSPPRRGSACSKNREQCLFELYIVRCAANQQRDTIHAVDHGRGSDRYRSHRSRYHRSVWKTCISPRDLQIKNTASFISLFKWPFHTQNQPFQSYLNSFIQSFSPLFFTQQSRHPLVIPP